MSKHDITTVCTLSAHLALRDALTTPGHSPTPCHIGAPMYARDAMALQRLGRRARRLIERGYARGPYGHHQRDKYEETQDIIGIGNGILKTYGLEARIGATSLIIIGLPGNTLGGDGQGFSI